MGGLRCDTEHLIKFSCILLVTAADGEFKVAPSVAEVMSTLQSHFTPSLNAVIDRFLLGKTSVKAGDFKTDLGSKPNAPQYFDWTTTTLRGDL